MSMRIAVLGESREFNIAVSGGPAKRAPRMKSSAKKNRKSRGPKHILKPGCPVVHDTFTDENAACVQMASVDTPCAGRCTSTITSTTTSHTLVVDDTAPPCQAASGIHETLSPRSRGQLVRSASVHDLRSPTAVLSPRRHSCDTLVELSVAAAAVSSSSCRQGSVSSGPKNYIGMTSHRQTVHLFGQGANSTITTGTNSSDYRLSGSSCATPNRPKRVGGGYMSPSLASPPHEIAASKAAQERINRRLSTVRVQCLAETTAERPSAQAATTHMLSPLTAVPEGHMHQADSATSPQTTADTDFACCTTSGDESVRAAFIAEPQSTAESSQTPRTTYQLDSLKVIETPPRTVDGILQECTCDALASTAKHPQDSCTSSFVSPVPTSEVVLAKSFDSSPFIAPKMIEQNDDGVIEASELIQNSVSMPFTHFQQAVKGNGGNIPTGTWHNNGAPPSGRPVVADITAQPPHRVQMFSPSTVLERSGYLTPLASPIPAFTGSHLTTSLVDVPVEALAAQLGLDISIERTQLRGGFWDRYATYTVRTRVFEGTQVKQEAIVERRFREFEAFWESMQAPGDAQHDVDFMQSLIHERLRAAIKLHELPSKVPIAPWRVAVVESRANSFRQLMLTVSSGCAGIKNLSSIPGWILDFLNVSSSLSL